jgi:hypothetical protein
MPSCKRGTFLAFLALEKEKFVKATLQTFVMGLALFQMPLPMAFFTTKPAWPVLTTPQTKPSFFRTMGPGLCFIATVALICLWFRHALAYGEWKRKGKEEHFPETWGRILGRWQIV